MSELRGWRRVLWVGSLLLALATITLLFLRYGVEWGIGRRAVITRAIDTSGTV